MDIEVVTIFSNALINKVLEIGVKYNLGRIEFLERVHCVWLKMVIVDEVESSANNMYETWFCRTPRKTFSIFLYSMPDHCEIIDIHFWKCHKLLPWGIMQKWSLIPFSLSPPSRHSVAHFMMWSLNTLLCSWCRRPGAKHQNGEDLSRKANLVIFPGSPPHTYHLNLHYLSHPRCSQ